MNMTRRLVVTTVAVFVMQGCAHTLTDDYGQYLQNTAGAAPLPRANVASQYYLTPATRAHRYEFRSAAAGVANKWIVEFGKVLDSTMQSPDVVNAFGQMTPVTES